MTWWMAGILAYIIIVILAWSLVRVPELKERQVRKDRMHSK